MGEALPHHRADHSSRAIRNEREIAANSLEGAQVQTLDASQGWAQKPLKPLAVNYGCFKAEGTAAVAERQLLKRGHMDHIAELDTVAVVSVTLLALTSILAALRDGDVCEWAPRFRLGFWILVQYSLGALVFSLLPSVARDFGITSWSWAVALLALFQFTSAVHFVWLHLSLGHSGSISPNGRLWFVGSVTMVLTPAVSVWSLFGGLGGASYGLYHFGVVICLLASLGAFVGFLRLDPHAEASSAPSEPRQLHTTRSPILAAWKASLTRSVEVALALQRPAPDGTLKIVATGERKDGLAA